MGTRPIALTADERALLALLDQGAGSGEHLHERSGFDQKRFDRATERLWRAALLQGIPGDGCCQDPCGINCISAFEPDRTWRLTELWKESTTGVVR
ncbi:hypothetical protein CAP40_19665 [Sphingomonas sp. IBVSS2]|nr:hypothetical protein CAP40_19665 [Sphingomonas sp. IBVSS2]